jgi:Bacterial archaeo-eukaryotic release factor family 10
MTLTRKTLNEILSLHDEDGVLSVYVDADPGEEAATRPAWRVRAERGLAALHERLSGDARRSAALARRVHHLRTVLDQTLDAAAPGRGRALFAPLGSSQVYTVAVQAELPDVVHLASVPHVVPLLRAWTLGAPAGVAVVSGDGIRLVDVRFGIAHDAAELAYHDENPGRRELTGPADANPARSQHSAPQHDLFSNRAMQRRLSFLRGAGPQIAAIGKQAGWEDLLVAGEVEQAAATIDGLPSGAQLPARTIGNSLANLPGAQVAAAVADTLAATRRKRVNGLAALARQAALSGGRGAYSLADVLTALGEGRVAHLVLDSEGRWRGRRTPDGRLVPGDEQLPGVAPEDLTAEEDLTDQMITTAFLAGAEVTVLDRLEDIAAAHGVAALLRW